MRAQDRESFCFIPPERLPASRSWKGPRLEKAYRRSRRRGRSALGTR